MPDRPSTPVYEASWGVPPVDAGRGGRRSRLHVDVRSADWLPALEQRDHHQHQRPKHDHAQRHDYCCSVHQVIVAESIRKNNK
jgi:hypothetical protein